MPRYIDAEQIHYEDLEFSWGIVRNMTTKMDVDRVPTANVIPKTKEAAIELLQETGWLQEHDKELTNSNEVVEAVHPGQHVFIVDKKKWEEAQKRSEEFWSSEEGQKLRQQIHDNAASFEELRKTGKTTVRVVSNED